MIKYNLHHVNGLFFEIKSDGGKNLNYNVTFTDNSSNKVIYETSLKPNMWSRLDKRYLTDVTIEVKYNNRTIEKVNILEHFKGKKVFISFESKSLGDTLAWIPYCEEFRIKYKCEVIVSTFMNSLFEKSYPELKFVGRGVVVENIAGMFELGWFYDKNKEPQHPVTIPLQQAATNILRLEYKEVIPKLDFTPKERPIEQKYVCISIHSTAQLKYWDYWQELVDWLVSEGYKVVEVSKEVSELNNLTEVLDKSLPSVMNYLHHAEFYIGLSSGISWLSFAMRKKVFMIANFSTKDHEFQTDCIRITDESVCHGCWNNPMFKFDKSSWGWCPLNEDTPQAFECHKSISAERVISIIQNETK
jgi:autotransporter strand-loop-strand O-heptosyltransferase